MKGKKPGRLVCGVGVNDAAYSVSPKIKINGKWVIDKENICPFYAVWSEMIKRCYSSRLKKLRPTYEKCICSEEWLTFSNFKAWMEQQDWVNKALDKDLLIESNKLYSKETCIFIDQKLNSFLTLRQNARGKFLLGVSLNKYGKPFKAEGYDEFKNKLYLGSFDSELEAHHAYLRSKLERIETFIRQASNELEILGLKRIKNKIEFALTQNLTLNSL